MEWRLLRGLPADDQRRLLDSARPTHFAPGDTIFQEGDTGATLHLLQSGRVAIRVSTPDGESATLTIVAPGDVFGEMALLRRSSTRTATAVALDEVSTLAIHRDSFARLRAEHPAAERLLTAILAERVDRLSTHLVEALYLNVDKRIVRRLAELCQIYPAAPPSPFVLPLTQQDLAGLAGTTRPTVNAVLQQLQRAGTVVLSRGRIEVIDRAALDHAGR